MSGPPVPAAEWATDSVADSAADSCDESEDPSAGRAPAHEATGATRLDVVLVRRGLARSRSAARDLLDAGRVRIAGVVTAKPSQSIDEATPIEVIGDRDPWVGRAAYKLIAALDTFRPAGLDVVGRRALDVGASTGGFTQVLLAAGAHQVVALDVGHGQLAPQLSAHPRVQERSGVNIRHVRPGDLGEPFDLVVGDASFISLTLVLPVLPALLAVPADVVLLVKPQFEVGRARLGKNGVVTARADRARSVRQVTRVACDLGFAVCDVIASPVRGNQGNAEFLVWLGWTGPVGLPAALAERSSDQASDQTSPDSSVEPAPRGVSRSPGRPRGLTGGPLEERIAAAVDSAELGAGTSRSRGCGG